MRRREPPEGWQPGYNCAGPSANECWCYADCMYDGNRWRIGSIDQSAGTLRIYRDLSGTGRSTRTVAIDRATAVAWHESHDCEHHLLSRVVEYLHSRVSQPETDSTTD